MMPRRALLLASPLLIAACSSLVDLGPGGPPPAIYTLPPVAHATDMTATPIRLLLEEPGVAGALDSDRIAVRRSPIRVEYLAGARWEDRVPRLIERHLTAYLDGRKGLAAVGALEADLPVAYRLRLDLRSFEADISEDGTSPRARVAMAATLQSATSSAIVAERYFTAAENADARDAEAIVRAMGTATDRIAAALADWIEALLAADTPTDRD